MHHRSTRHVAYQMQKVSAETKDVECHFQLKYTHKCAYDRGGQHRSQAEAATSILTEPLRCVERHVCFHRVCMFFGGGGKMTIFCVCVCVVISFFGWSMEVQREHAPSAESHQRRGDSRTSAPRNLGNGKLSAPATPCMMCTSLAREDCKKCQEYH